MTSKQRQLLETGFARATATVLRFFLRYRGLKVGSVAKDDLTSRILGYIESGDLTPTAVLSTLRAVQENKNKRVYCYHASSAAMKKATKSLPEQVADLADAQIGSGTATGEISYSYVEDGVIRVSFAERQTDYTKDITNLVLVPTRVTKVILLEADAKSGWVSLSYDPPAAEHSHGSAFGYYAHYRGWAEELLGSDLVPLDFSDVLDALHTRGDVRPLHMVVNTGDGNVELMGEGNDCRKMGVAPSVEEYVRARERGHYEWLAKSAGSSSASPLLRNILTDIQASPAMIRFSGDCLPEEVNHVLETVRTLY